MTSRTDRTGGDEAPLRREFRLRKVEQQFNEARIRALELSIHLMEQPDPEDVNQSEDTEDADDE